MIRAESAQPLFQKLNDILITKQYRDETTKSLKKVIFSMCLMDNIDTSEIENLINKIIEGLKKVETLEINTREQLCKIPEIEGDLDLAAGGYVTLSRKKLVVVKDELYDINLSHELIHLTQEEDSYNLSNNYDYVHLIQKAMKEGEASYYQALYTQKVCPNLIEINHRLKNRTNSREYNVFLEFYQDMKDLLGLEMIDKWKSISKEEDFMQEIEGYMQEHYQCSLGSFYQTWCVILYHYMSQYSKEYEEELRCSKKHQESNVKMFQFNYEHISQSLVEYPTYIKQAEEEIKKYELILENPQQLEQSMNHFIIEQKQQLREYIEENGEDDVSKEWEEDIKAINLETYKEAILNWKEAAEEKYKVILASQHKKQQELDYQKAFLIDPSLESLSIEELETLKNQQFAYFMQRRKQLESETLESPSNKQM